MEVSVLGATEVRRDAQLVDLGTRKQRALVAALALHRGRPVPVDLLVDLVWGERPPAAVGASLQSYVAGLRRSLEPERERRAPATVLVTVGTGYALRLPAQNVDAARFEQTVSALHRTIATPGLAADALAESVYELDAALDLWRGTPYLELEGAPDADAERARLGELHLLALEDRAVANLALGHHATVAAELETLTSAHPLRERLWALRALALLRSRRQGDALDVLRQVRELLIDELGMEPGAELRELQAAALRQDPSLDWVAPPASSAPAPAIAAPTASAPVTPAPVAPVQASVAAPPSRQRTRSAGAPLVGRDAELAALLDLLDVADTGVPAFAALTGDPGIGKTRLATELLAAAAERGVTTLTGRCSQDDGAPPLWPWLAVLDGLGKQLPVPAADDREDEGAQFRLWESITRWILDAARDTTVLVVMDDLHWADASTLRVLRLLFETAQDARLLVLTTWRAHPEPTGALADVAETLARRHALRVQLDGLDAAQAAEVVAAVAHAHPSEAEAQALADRTDGNPFFLVEYARLAAERGDLSGLLAEDEPPTAVHDVLVRRLAQLPDATRSVVRSAAVIGREFDAATLASVTGQDEDELLDLLEPAQVRGLVREDGIDRWAFAHALVRDTLYAGLPASRRARVHARVAGALAGSGHETERARHWIAAGPAAAAQAWPAAVAAAVATRRVHAHEQSAELLTAALSAMGQDPAATLVDRYEVLMQLADAYRWAGQQGMLIEAEVTAIRVARELGDVQRMAAAASAMTLGLWHSGGFGHVHAEVVDALTWCLQRLPEHDSRIRCHAVLSLANEQYFSTTLDERRALIDEAIAMARRIGDPALLLDALLVAYIALFCPRTGELRLHLATEAMDLATATGNERGLIVAATLRTIVEGELGRVRARRTTAALAQREASRLRHQFALVMLEAMEVPWLAMAGSFDQCEQRLARMHRLMMLMNGELGEEDIFTVVSLGCWRGRSLEATAEVAAVDGGPAPLSATVAVCLLRGGSVDAARSYLAEHPVDLDHDTWLSMMVWCHAAEAALGLGDPDLAGRSYAMLLPYEGRSSSAGAHNAMGPVDGFLACAAAAQGLGQAATTHADRAARLMQEWEIPLAAQWLQHLRARHGF